MARLDPPRRQLQAALYVARYEEAGPFGVIVEPAATADAIIRRGLAELAERKPYYRATGLCVRLTEAGRKLAKEYQ